MAFYVTTPIYYVNGEPHLGHAYSTIAADILARHHRQRGRGRLLPDRDRRVRRAGRPAGRGARASPRASWATGWRPVSRRWPARSTPRTISSSGRPTRGTRSGSRRSCSGSTTTATSTRGSYEGWYCPRCADFKTESEIEDGNRCPIHKIELDPREGEELVLPALGLPGGPGEALRGAPRSFVEPDFRRNEALAFIRQGLQDVSLSRRKLKWGVPVPWDTDQVIYVWFDALLNYYTALSYAEAVKMGWRGPDRALLARVPHPRQGHPQVPRGLLAGLPDGRGDRGAEGDVHPRLPADGGPQDVEVARQRARGRPR